MKFTNILYIEDDPDTRFLQARLWRKFDGHVEVAPPEQWDALRGSFEWVLLDFHLGAETALDWIPKISADSQKHVLPCYRIWTANIQACGRLNPWMFSFSLSQCC